MKAAKSQHFGMPPRARRHAAALFVVCAIVAVALVAAYAMRLYAVNDGFRGIAKLEFGRNETAVYASSSNGQPIAEGEVEVRATSFKGLSADELKSSLADADPVEVARIENGGDAELLSVGLSVKNASASEKQVFLGAFQLTSQAWSNGVAVSFLPDLNGEDASVSLDLAPGQEGQVTLPFFAYDYQFADAWSSLDQRDFRLVLSVQPKLYAIALGRFDASGS